MKEYSIIWIPFSKDSDVGQRIMDSKDFALPYFVDGNDKQQFEESNPGGLSPVHLLRGILVGYSDEPPIVDTSTFKQKAKVILMDLQNHFDYDSLEDLILNISAFIRQENGDTASFEALLTGTKICPESSKIKFDCCTDLYNLLEREQFHDKEWGKKKLGELLYQIERDKINPTFVSYIDTFKEWAE
ncbi:hypothetical protein [Rhodohalobacter mucosus]|uniref:Uncharacterized protein n=1 Tax=Rhodohalobacter mucosus TaxID=2079485 RepID=A0A316TVI5_9BACT|nr:hypothetical protein [Rhodohalobacter mucosus]PWN06474.1 hypothetical protein DDZ15_08100 [Rhodohalobacter mucosus]